MSIGNSEIKTYFGRCRCCLNYGYLKSMWEEHIWQGEKEVYVELLNECFALTWEHCDESMDNDQICETCITRLRDADNFKKTILQSRGTLFDLVDEEPELPFKIERLDNSMEEYSEMEARPTTSNYIDDPDDPDYVEPDDNNDTDYEEVEYLEIEDNEEALAGQEKQQTQSTTESRSKKPVVIEPTRKWPKKLPKSERYKTYKQYTEEDLRKCLDAVRKEELTPQEASKIYNIPKETICLKVKADPIDEQKDNTTYKTKLEPIKTTSRKIPRVLHSDIVRYKIIKKIESIKMKTAKVNDDDKEKNVTEVLMNIENKGIDAIDRLFNADQVRIKYKALVDAKFKKERKEPEKNDVHEMNKHKSNIRNILEYSNATMVKGFWGNGYMCCFCNVQKKMPSELKAHNLEAHSSFEDDVLKLKYMSTLFIRLDITNLKCKLCEDNIDSLELLMDHLAKVHDKIMHSDIKKHLIPFNFENNTLQCVKCKKQFQYFKILSEHMNEHYRNYECSICERAFITKETMQRHFYRHISGVFKCSYCPKVLDTKYKKFVHERVTHTWLNKTRKCNYCDERFSSKDVVLRHEAKVHGAKIPVFNCQACNKSYNSQSSLLTHRKRFHLMLRPHKCSYCDMAFYSRMELRAHEVTHTKARDFKCDVCDKCFGTRCTLNQHMRIHLDDRRFKCESCDNAFLYRTHFKVHMRSKHDQQSESLDEKAVNKEKMYQMIQEVKTILTYTNATPYKSKANRYYCAYCSTEGPFFKEADELRTHTRTEHVNDRTHKIEYALRPHWMNETLKLDIDNLLCNVCCTPLSTWNDMFTHLKVQHKIILDQAYTRVIPYVLTNDLHCAFCKEGFTNYMQLDGHMNAHYNNYVCEDCGDTYLAASRLKKHKKIHEIGRYPCSSCSKVFSLEKYRKKHEDLVHKQATKFKCWYCEDRFSGEYLRHLHVLDKHKEKVKNITCEQCGKTFTWRPYYVKHMRRKHTEDPKKFSCLECDKKFFQPFELKEHMLRHTGEKRFPCKLCNKRFISSASLKHHYYWHKKKDGVQLINID